jgi:methionyl aminopeptidase
MAILKSKADLELLRYSCRITASCLYHLRTMIQPGISAKILDNFCMEFFSKYNAVPSFLNYSGLSPRPFQFALCTSINSEVVHGFSSEDKIIPENAVVSLDLGCNYKGLFSDAAISVIVGTVAKEVEDLVVNTQKAMMEGIASIRAGTRVGDIGFAVNRLAKKHGYGNVYELGGHGVGYSVHEEPFIPNLGQKGQGTRLFENQIICIEPMFTLGSDEVDFSNDGWTVISRDKSIAAHWEHEVIVTKTGCEILTEITDHQILPI